MDNSVSKKRTFGELRQLILAQLADGRLTTNQISIKTGINWRTVEAHLTFLIGKGMVAEVLKSEYVRIFELTENGWSQLRLIAGQKKEEENTPQVVEI